MKQTEYNELLDAQNKLYDLIKAIQLSPNGVIVMDQDLDYISPAYKALDEIRENNYPIKSW